MLLDLLFYCNNIMQDDTIFCLNRLVRAQAEIDAPEITCWRCWVLEIRSSNFLMRADRIVVRIDSCILRKDPTLVAISQAFLSDRWREHGESRQNPMDNPQRIIYMATTEECNVCQSSDRYRV